MHLPPTYASRSAAAIEALEDVAPVLHAPAALAVIPKPSKAVDLTLVARLKALTVDGSKDGKGTGRRIWTGGALARALGVNTSYISTYLRQESDSPPEITFSVPSFEAKVRDFLHDLSTRRAYDGGIFQTAIIARFSAFVDSVRGSREIGVFYGSAGVGKTTAIEAYQTKNSNTLALCATRWSCGAAGMESQLAAALKIGTAPRGSCRGAEIAAKLGAWSGCLIVDNAHRLTRGAVEFFFDLYDLTNIPQIFAGNRLFVDKLLTKDPELKGDDQLYSRLFLKTEAKFQDTPSLNAAADALLKRECPEHFGALKSLARRVAAEPGHLRSLVKRLRLLGEIYQREGYRDAPVRESFLAAHAASIHTGYSLDD